MVDGEVRETVAAGNKPPSLFKHVEVKISQHSYHTSIAVIDPHTHADR